MTTEQPLWFKRKDYTFLENLNARGWCAELIRVADALDSNDWRKEWRDIIPQCDDYVRAVISPPAVEVIDHEEAARKLEKLEEPAMLLRIHLGAPDATIMLAIREALLKARQNHPGPIKRPGKRSTGSTFNANTFASWRRHKIIQLAELLAWKQRDGLKSISKAQIGRWLFSSDPKKSVEAAEKVMRRAIDSVPALDMQAAEASARK
jgi:hypothetical protein